jgi:hypothetical protein
MNIRLLNHGGMTQAVRPFANSDGCIITAGIADDCITGGCITGGFMNWQLHDWR